MDKLLSALGVEVRDFAFKTECCGAAFSMPKREMVNELTYKVLNMAVDAGANCVVVACPLCQQNLDLRQGQVNSLMGSKFNLPVLYFTQVMGLAYGYSPKELGMDKIFVSADPCHQAHYESRIRETEGRRSGSKEGPQSESEEEAAEETKTEET